MKREEFDDIVAARLQVCKDTLSAKGGEYARGDDRLSNFKKAAKLTGQWPPDALLGIMVKHVVAIYDFAEAGETNMDRWSEKITDTINYLLLLEGLMKELTNGGA
jgi:hypothetical protein